MAEIWREIERFIIDDEAVDACKTPYQEANWNADEARRLGVDYGNCWLGRFYPLDPGWSAFRDTPPLLIQLHRDRIVRSFRATVDAARAGGYPLSRREHLRRIGNMRVHDVYAHEQFHRSSSWQFWKRNVPKQPGGIEEALATAWGWFACQAHGRRNRLPQRLIEFCAKYWFDEIDLPGYRDWAETKRGCCFRGKLQAYWYPDAAAIAPGVIVDPLATMQALEARTLYQVVSGPDHDLQVLKEWRGDASATHDAALQATLSFWTTSGHSRAFPASFGSLKVDCHVFSGPPRVAWTVLCLGDQGLTTAQNIHKVLDPASNANIPSGNTRLCLSASPLASRLLGVLLIKHLQSICMDDKDFEAIVNKYLPSNTKMDVIKCQMDLIKSGFKAFAQI